MSYRLKHLLRMNYGSSLSAEIREEGVTPVYGSNGQVGVHSIANTGAPAIIVGRKGSHGKVAWAEKGGFCIDTAFYVDGSCTTGNLRYIYYLLQTLGLDDASKEAAVPGLDRSEAYNKKIANIPAREQGAIADFLDRETALIDQLVEKKQQLTSLLHAKRGSEYSETLKSFGAPPSVFDVKVFEAPNVDESWSVQRIKHLVKFMTSGSRGWSDLIQDAGELFLQSGNIGRNMEVDFTGASRVQPQFGAEADRTMLKAGDVLVCITGGRTGAVGYVPSVSERAYINQHICLVRPVASRIAPRLLAHSLYSDFGQSQFGIMQYGLKSGLGFRQVGEVKVPVPPRALQLSILKAIDSAMAADDAVANQVVASINCLAEFRSALITAAVTGQIDVTTWGKQGQTDRRLDNIQEEIGA